MTMKIDTAKTIENGIDVCEMDALLLHGLAQALENLEGVPGNKTDNARNALVSTIERMAYALAKQLGALSRSMSLEAANS